MSKISGILFFDFYFLNVDISLIMHNPCLKLYKCVENIVGNYVSDSFYIGPGSFSRTKTLYKILRCLSTILVEMWTIEKKSTKK